MSGAETVFHLSQKEAFLLLEKMVVPKNFGAGSYDTKTRQNLTIKDGEVLDTDFIITVSKSEPST